MLRKKGVVGKFVEFFGDGLTHLPLADRATIANMAPEYGATCGLFPIDEETLAYLRLTGRTRRTGRSGRGLCAGTAAVPRATMRPQPANRTLSSWTLASVVAEPRRTEAAAGPRSARRDARPRFLRGDCRLSRQETQPDQQALSPPRIEAAGSRTGRRCRRYRRDHLLHQHLQSLGHGRGRPGCTEGHATRSCRSSPG